MPENMGAYKEKSIRALNLTLTNNPCYWCGMGVRPSNGHDVIKINNTPPSSHVSNVMTSTPFYSKSQTNIAKLSSETADQ